MVKCQIVFILFYKYEKHFRAPQTKEIRPQFIQCLISSGNILVYCQCQISNVIVTFPVKKTNQSNCLQQPGWWLLVLVLYLSLALFVAPATAAAFFNSIIFIDFNKNNWVLIVCCIIKYLSLDLKGLMKRYIKYVIVFRASTAVQNVGVTYFKLQWVEDLGIYM